MLTRLIQVHADASNFAEGVTKEEAYQQVLDQAEGLFFEQRNWVRAVGAHGCYGERRGSPLPVSPFSISSLDNPTRLCLLFISTLSSGNMTAANVALIFGLGLVSESPSRPLKVDSRPLSWEKLIGNIISLAT